MLYAIIEGYTVIWCETEVLKYDKFFISFRGPGDLLGEIGIVSPNRHRVHIRATDDCTLIELPPNILKARTESSIYQNLSAILAKKIYLERLRSEVLSIPAGIRRVALTLYNLLSDDFRGSIPVHVTIRGTDYEGQRLKGTIRPRDIAGYVAATDRTVYRHLSRLEQNGLVHVSNGVITVLDAERLDLVSGDESILPKQQVQKKTVKGDTRAPGTPASA